MIYLETPFKKVSENVSANLAQPPDVSRISCCILIHFRPTEIRDRYRTVNFVAAQRSQGDKWEYGRSEIAQKIETDTFRIDRRCMVRHPTEFVHHGTSIKSRKDLKSKPVSYARIVYS